MRKQLIKGVAYTTAPKLTFTALNPKKAAFAKAAGWATDHIMPHRRRRSRTDVAMKGLGAAALAIPVGIWLGRHFRGSDRSEQVHLH